MRKCRIHGTVLQDVDWGGRKFHRPTCLECLPPHHPGCMQGLYMEKQAMFLGFQRDLEPDYDLTDGEFWERFGLVPACICSSRSKQLERREDLPEAPPAPAFELTFGRDPSAFTWRRMTRRLAAMLVQEPGKKAARHWGLEALAASADLMPTESARARARAILERLRQFEGGKSWPASDVNSAREATALARAEISLDALRQGVITPSLAALQAHAHHLGV